MDELSLNINTIKNNFNINNIKDYQNILLLIYNSFFIYDNLLTSKIKYELFLLLDNCIKQIEKNKIIYTIEDIYNILINEE